MKKFSARELADVNSAIALLPEAIAKPHVHAGLGVRKLRRAIFEIRSGLQIRVLFALESGDIVLVFAGDHNQVRAWLKQNT